MASIFKTLDDLVTNVSEKINKDKWDRSALNPALLADANEAEEKAKEEERLKHFQSQLENRVPVAAGAETVTGINTVVCAEAPAPAENSSTAYAGFSDMEMLLTPPDLPVKPVKPVKTESVTPIAAKKLVATAPVPTVPVSNIDKSRESANPVPYEKPVFKSRFSGPKKQTEQTAETIPTYGAHPTIPLSDLPVIDPSQSLSAMMKQKEEQLEAQPLTTTILAHTYPNAVPEEISEEVSEEQPAEEEIEKQPVIEEQKEIMPPVYAVPEVPAEVALEEPKDPNVEPVGLQGLYGTVPETVEERTAEQQLHTEEIESTQKQEEVVVEPKASVEMPVETPIETPIEKPIEKPEETEEVKAEAVKTEAVSPVEDKKNPCYYILIKHTKTYPEKGSLVMMRGCDHEYAWTNKQDESEMPTYDICPGCGKPISHTSIEMD